MVDVFLANGLDPNQKIAVVAAHYTGLVCGHDTIVEMLCPTVQMPKLKIVMEQLLSLARKEGHAKVLLQLSLRHLLKHWSRLQEATL